MHEKMSCKSQQNVRYTFGQCSSIIKDNRILHFSRRSDCMIYWMSRCLLSRFRNQLHTQHSSTTGRASAPGLPAAGNVSVMNREMMHMRPMDACMQATSPPGFLPPQFFMLFYDALNQPRKQA